MKLFLQTDTSNPTSSARIAPNRHFALVFHSPSSQPVPPQATHKPVSLLRKIPCLPRFPVIVTCFSRIRTETRHRARADLAPNMVFRRTLINTPQRGRSRISDVTSRRQQSLSIPRPLAAKINRKKSATMMMTDVGEMKRLRTLGRGASGAAVSLFAAGDKADPDRTVALPGPPMTCAQPVRRHAPHAARAGRGGGCVMGPSQHVPRARDIKREAFFFLGATKKKRTHDRAGCRASSSSARSSSLV